MLIGLIKFSIGYDIMRLWKIYGKHFKKPYYIKPENLFLKTEDKFTILKIGDFGLSKNCEVSGAGSMVFTEHYISPEMKNAKTVTDAIDVWGIGLSIYNLIYRNNPYDDFPKINNTGKNLIFHGKKISTELKLYCSKLWVIILRKGQRHKIYWVISTFQVLKFKLN